MSHENGKIRGIPKRPAWKYRLLVRDAEGNTLLDKLFTKRVSLFATAEAWRGLGSDLIIACLDTWDVDDLVQATVADFDRVLAKIKAAQER